MLTKGLAPLRCSSKRARRQVFVAAAHMEYEGDGNDRVARNVFELGLDHFLGVPGYVLQYADFLIGLADLHNARALFERALGETPPAGRQAPVGPLHPGEHVARLLVLQSQQGTPSLWVLRVVWGTLLVTASPPAACTSTSFTVCRFSSTVALCRCRACLVIWRLSLNWSRDGGRHWGPAAQTT